MAVGAACGAAAVAVVVVRRPRRGSGDPLPLPAQPAVSARSMAQLEGLGCRRWSMLAALPTRQMARRGSVPFGGELREERRSAHRSGYEPGHRRCPDWRGAL